MLVRWTSSYPRIEERELEAGVLGRSAGRSTAAATPTGATSPSVASSARCPGDEDRAETALPPGARA